MLIFDADAEHASDGFVAHRGAVFLAILAVGPRSHEAPTALAVGDHGGREIVDGLHIQIAERSTAGIRDIACAGIDGPNLLVPQTP